MEPDGAVKAAYICCGQRRCDAVAWCHSQPKGEEHRLAALWDELRLSQYGLGVMRRDASHAR